MIRRFAAEVRVLVDGVEATSRNAVTDDPGGTTRQAIVVLLTATLSLTSISYLQGGSPWSGLADAATPEFARLARWTVVNLAGYLLLPWLVVRFVLGGRLRDYGWARHAPGGWRVYVGLLATSVPFVAWAATWPGFAATYPFYRLSPGESPWPWLAVWWVLYAAQFLGVEAFFRGFLVHGTKARFGIGSVVVMVVPYVMIHFAKPAPEALAAIVGGVVLGGLSLATGSIWWGVGVHVAIALVMDLVVIAGAGAL